MIKISIITPVYNVEKCIEKSVNSVISQSDKNFEYILIDDGSKDNSINLAEKLLKNSDINYNIIRKHNEGVSKARNLGINISKGEYIAFLDSDDYIDENFVKEMYDTAKEYDSDIVFCDYSEVNAKYEIIVKSRCPHLKSPITGAEAALKQLNDEIVIGMRSAIYKNNIIKDNNITFDTNRKYAEDMIFIVKCLMYSDRVMSNNKILAYYVLWENGITQNVSLKHLDCYNSYKDLLVEIENNNFNRDNIDFSDIKKYLKEYKLAYAVCHIFSILSRDKNFTDDLLKFLSQKKIKEALKDFKIQKFDKKNIRFFIQSKLILYFPKSSIRIFSILR